jgi:hypothetical protein
MSQISGIGNESQWIEFDNSAEVADSLSSLAKYFQLSNFTAFVPVPVPHNKNLTNPKAVTVHLYKNGEEISFIRSNESEIALDVTIYETISNVEIVVS